ncbi:MAG: hypothetical protein ACYDD9_06455 [Acidithiobacillus sp.]
MLDAAERTGKLNLRSEEIRAALPGVTPTALRQAISIRFAMISWLSCA